MLYSKKDLEFELSYVKQLIDGIQEKSIRDRISNVLTWYVRGAYTSRGRYMASMAFSALCSAAIPVLMIIQGLTVIGLIASILSAVSGISMVLNSYYKWHDGWLRNRRNAEVIKSKAVLFIHGFEPYDNAAAAQQFVQDIEGIVMEEGNKWFSGRSKQNDGQANTSLTLNQ
jgi:hypothetical protein